MPDTVAMRERKTRALRTRMLGMAAASYGLDTLLLAGFALAGTVPAAVPLAYGLAGATACALFGALFAQPRRAARADPYLTVPQMLLATLIQLAAAVLVPQLAFLFLMLLTIVFLFASLRLGTRATLVAWLAISAGMGAALYLVGARAGLPGHTPLERALVWLSYALTFGRCALLGTFGRSLRDALSRRHRELTQVLGTLQERDAELAANRLVLERVNAELRHQAMHDALTGLPNRALYADRLHQAMARADRDQAPFAVLVVDLDRFKLVNDTLGHGVGDQLLCHVAARLKAAVRDIDTVARAGGDEFLLILPDVAERAAIEPIAEKLIAAVGEACRVAATELHTSPSIGISLYPADATTAEALVARADEAMYAAKKLGRNTFQFFEPGMAEFSHQHLELEGELRRALALGQLELHYQPKIEVGSGSITSVEALLRWRHPERGLVPAAQFVPLAEQTGLILSIGRWVLREACRQARAWQLAGLPFLRVAVNLSPVQFRQAGLLAVIRAALADHGLEPRYLELEVNEATVMSHAEGSIGILEELSRMGVIVAIDDFGTGYSSMSYLRRFPIDKLKIDRSFVQELTRSADDASIVRAIISLAHGLRLKVVAEGVETPAQLDALRQLGCDQYQGYYMSPAVPAAQVEALVRAQSPAGGPAGDEFMRTQSRLAAYRGARRPG